MRGSMYDVLGGWVRFGQDLEGPGAVLEGHRAVLWGLGAVLKGLRVILGPLGAVTYVCISLMRGLQKRTGRVGFRLRLRSFPNASGVFLSFVCLSFMPAGIMYPATPSRVRDGRSVVAFVMIDQQWGERLHPSCQVR